MKLLLQRICLLSCKEQLLLQRFYLSCEVKLHVSAVLGITGCSGCLRGLFSC